MGTLGGAAAREHTRDQHHVHRAERGDSVAVRHRDCGHPEHAGEIVSREDLLERVWGYDVFPSTRTVDNFILRLRTRFEKDPGRPRHFLTVWGVGYRFLTEGEP